MTCLRGKIYLLRNLRNPLSRNQSIFALVGLALAISLGVHAYNLVVARKSFIEGEVFQKQVAELQAEQAEAQVESRQREARLVDMADRATEETRRVLISLASLYARIPTQTTQQDVTTLVRLLDRPGLRVPTVAPDASSITLDREYIKAIELRFVDLQQQVARIPALEAQLAILAEKNTNLENALEREIRISREKDKAIEAFRKSARKSRVRRVLGHPFVKAGIFAAGVYVGSI